MNSIRDIILSHGGKTSLARKLEGRLIARGRKRHCYPSLVDRWEANGAIPGFWVRMLVEIGDEDGNPLTRDQVLDLVCKSERD
jgi:hypothetical protein